MEMELIVSINLKKTETMKKVFLILVTAASLAACDNSANTVADKKDSIDSTASEKKEMIDSTAEQKKDKVDSTAENMKEAMEKKDSTHK